MSSPPEHKPLKTVTVPQVDTGSQTVSQLTKKLAVEVDRRSPRFLGPDENGDPQYSLEITKPSSIKEWVKFRPWVTGASLHQLTPNELEKELRAVVDYEVRNTFIRSGPRSYRSGPMNDLYSYNSLAHVGYTQSVLTKRGIKRFSRVLQRGNELVLKEGGNTVKNSPDLYYRDLKYTWSASCQVAFLPVAHPAHEMTGEDMVSKTGHGSTWWMRSYYSSICYGCGNFHGRGVKLLTRIPQHHTSFVACLVWPGKSAQMNKGGYELLNPPKPKPNESQKPKKVSATMHGPGHDGTFNEQYHSVHCPYSNTLTVARSNYVLPVLAVELEYVNQLYQTIPQHYSYSSFEYPSLECSMIHLADVVTRGVKAEVHDPGLAKRDIVNARAKVAPQVSEEESSTATTRHDSLYALQIPKLPSHGKGCKQLCFILDLPCESRSEPMAMKNVLVSCANLCRSMNVPQENCFAVVHRTGKKPHVISGVTSASFAVINELEMQSDSSVSSILPALNETINHALSRREKDESAARLVAFQQEVAMESRALDNLTPSIRSKSFVRDIVTSTVENAMNRSIATRLVDKSHSKTIQHQLQASQVATRNSSLHIVMVKFTTTESPTEKNLTADELRELEALARDIRMMKVSCSLSCMLVLDSSVPSSLEKLCGADMCSEQNSVTQKLQLSYIRQWVQAKSQLHMFEYTRQKPWLFADCFSQDLPNRFEKLESDLHKYFGAVTITFGEKHGTNSDQAGFLYDLSGYPTRTLQVSNTNTGDSQIVLYRQSSASPLPRTIVINDQTCMRVVQPAPVVIRKSSQQKRSKAQDKCVCDSSTKIAQACNSCTDTKCPVHFNVLRKYDSRTRHVSKKHISPAQVDLNVIEPKHFHWVVEGVVGALQQHAIRLAAAASALRPGVENGLHLINVLLTQLEQHHRYDFDAAKQRLEQSRNLFLWKNLDDAKAAVRLEVVKANKRIVGKLHDLATLYNTIRSTVNVKVADRAIQLASEPCKWLSKVEKMRYGAKAMLRVLKQAHQPVEQVKVERGIEHESTQSRSTVVFNVETESNSLDKLVEQLATLPQSSGTSKFSLDLNRMQRQAQTTRASMLKTLSDALYVFGVHGLPMHIERSESAVVNPWNIQVKQVFVTKSLTTNDALCLLDSACQDESVDRNSSPLDVLVLPDPSEVQRTHTKSFFASEYYRAYVACVFARNPLVTVADQHAALHMIALVQLGEQAIRLAAEIKQFPFKPASSEGPIEIASTNAEDSVKFSSSNQSVRRNSRDSLDDFELVSVASNSEVASQGSWVFDIDGELLDIEYDLVDVDDDFVDIQTDAIANNSASSDTNGLSATLEQLQLENAQSNVVATPEQAEQSNGVATPEQAAQSNVAASPEQDERINTLSETCRAFLHELNVVAHIVQRKLRRRPETSNSWVSILKSLSHSNCANMFTESDGVHSVCMLVAALTCTEQGSRLLFDSEQYPILAMSFLAEATSRACRIMLHKDSDRAREMIRQALHLSTDDNVEPPAQTQANALNDATMQYVRQCMPHGRRESSKFFAKKWGNCSPFGIVGTLGLAKKVYAAHGYRSTQPGETQEQRYPLNCSTLGDEALVPLLRNALLENEVSMSTFIKECVPTAKPMKVQVALYVQGIRYHKSATRKETAAGMVHSLFAPEKVILSIARDEYLRISRDKMAREFALAGKAKRNQMIELRRKLGASVQEEFIQQHSGVPVIFTEQELSIMNAKRSPDDQLVVDQGGLLRHRCGYPNCPQFMVDLATFHDRALGTRNGLMKHLAPVFWPRRLHVPALHRRAQALWLHHKRDRPGFVRVLEKVVLDHRPALEYTAQEVKELCGDMWDMLSEKLA